MSSEKPKTAENASSPLYMSNGGEDNASSSLLLRVDEVESRLAKAMNKMSMDERNKVLEDVHGVPTPDIEETLGFVAGKLDEFDIEIAKEKTTIYETAFVQSKEYVEDPNFRLMFLRSVLFDVPAATKRLMSFLEFKVKLFGIEKLTKEITLSDLTEENINFLKAGLVQVLPEKDAAGRSVICLFPELANWMGESGNDQLSLVS